ncbi:MAG: helix-turn-helix domain-containing protein [Actinomycetota bacterium]
MARKNNPDDKDNFSGLSEEVGARLAERRRELGATLRDVAAQAEVSASHLSEIENGRSQVSLPVLLRLVRALDLTISELLPRIGGQRVRGGSLNDLGDGIAGLSHHELELVIEHHQLEPSSSVLVENRALADLLIHVLSGRVTVDAAGQTIELGPGDSLDTERLPQTKLTADAPATVLTVTRSEEP